MAERARGSPAEPMRRRECPYRSCTASPFTRRTRGDVVVSRILLVEDDTTIGTLLTASLRSHAYEVTWERTGAGALARAATEPRRPHASLVRDHLLGKFHFDPEATGVMPLGADSGDSPEPMRWEGVALAVILPKGAMSAVK